MLDYFKNLMSEIYEYEGTKVALFIGATISIYTGLIYLAPGSIFIILGCLIMWKLFKEE